MTNLKIIIGSTRPGRAANQVISWIVPVVRAPSGFDVEVADLREWDLPIFGETLAAVGDFRDPTFPAPAVKRRNSMIAEGEALWVITPTYNHSLAAVLKNPIDIVFATCAFRTEPVACVAYSGGIAAGTRANEHLAQIAIEAEMVPLRNSVIIPFVNTAFGPASQPASHGTAAAKIPLGDLARCSTTLRQARSARTLPSAAMRLEAASQGATR